MAQLFGESVHLGPGQRVWSRWRVEDVRGGFPLPGWVPRQRYLPEGEALEFTDPDVALPAARPAMSMLGMFTFVGSWTNFFWPFIVLGPKNPTLPIALTMLQGRYFTDYSLVMTGVLITTIPLMILFFFAGRQLVAGVMQGAVKG